MRKEERVQQYLATIQTQLRHLRGMTLNDKMNKVVFLKEIFHVSNIIDPLYITYQYHCKSENELEALRLARDIWESFQAEIHKNINVIGYIGEVIKNITSKAIKRLTDYYQLLIETGIESMNFDLIRKEILE